MRYSFIGCYESWNKKVGYATFVFDSQSTNFKRKNQ